MRWELVYRATVYIAEEAGAALRRSALSPNIRERMDHSVAVLDAEGRIVAQAEHIPVHLGSFRVGVGRLLEALEREGIELGPGDAALVNDPYIAGTHLNDVMLLSPIHWRGRIVGYVVNKAHHVDVGGPVPGSINPWARTMHEEGVVMPPLKAVEGGQVRRDLLAVWLANVRDPATALGDLNAQLAANVVGTRRIAELLERYGEEVLEAWDSAIDYGRRLSLLALAGWPRGTFEAEDHLEWGEGLLPIRVKVSVRDDGVTLDFAGSAHQVEGPLNAVFGVTYSAAAFPVRCLLGSDVPTNEGFYSVVQVAAPEGTIVNPRRPAAVSGGNLETSQRIADAVFRALAAAMPERVPAAGSGTMANIMIGGVWRGSSWSYYETVGGGTGGRPGKDGVSGVHVNMTNTMNTPIEVVELAYPLLFTRYMVREGSGGRGRWRGGDGIIRSFKALAPMRLALLADRFKVGPWGLMGGEPGSPGRAYVVRASGERVELAGKAVLDLYPGDEFVLETPGGGGWGAPHG